MHGDDDSYSHWGRVVRSRAAAAEQDAALNGDLLVVTDCPIYKRELDAAFFKKSGMDCCSFKELRTSKKYDIVIFLMRHTHAPVAYEKWYTTVKPSGKVFGKPDVHCGIGGW